MSTSTFRLLSDDPRFGMAAGDVLECVPYDGDDEKLVVLRRTSDGYDPGCTVYRTQVVPAPTLLDQPTLDDAPLVLTTVLGSRAYGTARPGSDTDLVVVRSFTPAQLTGLTPPEPRGWARHVVDETQDVATMDAQVLLTQVLAGKPRAVETLHSNPACYTGGQDLVEARSALLTAGGVADGYGRYLRGVARRLLDGHDKDRSVRWKSALTMYRLGVHAERLWRTGTLALGLDRDEAFAVADWVADGDLAPVHMAMDTQARLWSSPTVLPWDDTAAVARARTVLAQVRRAVGETW